MNKIKKGRTKLKDLFMLNSENFSSISFGGFISENLHLLYSDIYDRI